MLRAFRPRAPVKLTASLTTVSAAEPSETVRRSQAYLCRDFNLTYLSASHPAPEFAEETYYASKVHGLI
jgi:hypothetical protein